MRTISLSLLSMLVLGTMTVACGDDGETGGGGDASTSTSATKATSTSAQTSTSSVTTTAASTSSGGSTNGTAYERAAIVYASCFPDNGANDALRFLDRALGIPEAALDTFIQCMANVTEGCTQAYQCGFAFSNDGDDCPTTCNGDVLTGCDDSWRFTADCAAFGLACLGEACLPPGAATCTIGSPDTCNGTVKNRCGNGYVETEDCADHGQTCAVDDSDPQLVYAYCKSSDTPCTPGMNVCNGAAIEICDREDNVLSTPCDAGETCHLAGTEPFCGTANACDPFSDPTCNGNVLTVCDGGAVVQIDCAALGFTSCMSAGDQTRCGPGW